MANMMTKRGSHDNMVTYEHVCDTIADMANIPSDQITLGSTCIVLHGESGELEIYLANSQKEWMIAANNNSVDGNIVNGNVNLANIYNLIDARIKNINSFDVEIAQTIPPANFNQHTIYFVPNDDTLTYTEYMFINYGWEKIGETINSQQIYNNVNSIINSRFDEIKSFDIIKVNSLPTTNINMHAIYFVPSNNNDGTYDEYMLIDGHWELLGSTGVNLSNYLLKSDIANWAKAENKPTYTAAEVDAVPKYSQNNTSTISHTTTETQGDNLLILNCKQVKFQVARNNGTSYVNAGIQYKSPYELKLISSQNNTYGTAPAQVRLSNVETPTQETDAANKNYVDGKISNLATVARTGDYTDLNNKPCVISQNNQLLYEIDDFSNIEVITEENAQSGVKYRYYKFTNISSDIPWNKINKIDISGDNIYNLNLYKSPNFNINNEFAYGSFQNNIPSASTYALHVKSDEVRLYVPENKILTHFALFGQLPSLVVNVENIFIQKGDMAFFKIPKIPAPSSIKINGQYPTYTLQATYANDGVLKYIWKREVNT